MKELKMGMRRRVARFQDEGEKWRLPGLLYADDLVLCGESEKDLREMVDFFDEMYRRRGLKVNAGKNKVILLGEEKGYDWRIYRNLNILDAYR